MSSSKIEQESCAYLTEESRYGHVKFTLVNTAALMGNQRWLFVFQIAEIWLVYQLSSSEKL